MGSELVAVWVIRCRLFPTHYGEYQAKKYGQKFLRKVLFGSLVNYAIFYLKSYQTGQTCFLWICRTHD